MRCSVLLFSALSTILLPASIGLANTILVPADQPTIQAGIDEAVDGDTVLVAPGTYTGPGNIKLDFGGKAIVVISEGGPEATIIDGAGGARAFSFHSEETTSSVICGFTIQHTIGAIYCHSSNPTITHSTFIGNMASDGEGGAIHCNTSSPTISNNTFKENSAAYGGGAITCFDARPTVKNCILWGDTPNEISSSATVTYPDVQGGWPGEGNIDADPLFVLPEKRDCRLLWDSPCIDTGDPTLSDADGTRSDVGAHHFNQLDYLALYVTPDKVRTRPGEEFGVTYPAINRWDRPKSFWVLAQVPLPNGPALNVLGPSQYILPANYTAQVHVSHPVPNATPPGVCRYLSVMGVPHSTLYDWDRFKFWIIR